jgi:hypothetical protein
LQVKFKWKNHFRPYLKVDLGKVDDSWINLDEKARTIKERATFAIYLV